MIKRKKYEKEASTMISPVVPDSDADKTAKDKDADCTRKEGYRGNLKNIWKRWIRFAFE